MQHVYLGRQPIIDSDSNLCAYEIVYRDNEKRSKISGNRFASASVINSILNKFGTRSLLGHRKALIKVDEKFLLHDIIFSIPSEFFVFSLFDSIKMSERVVERVEQLKEKGYELALNDVYLDAKKLDEYRPILKNLSFVKVKLSENLPLNFKEIISELQANGIKVIGTKIENTKQYSLARSLGCDWFQGYFFAEAKIMENAKYEPSQMNVLKLYNLLMQDTNIDEITSEFEHNHEITVQLLQFINSGAFHFRSRISSIHHVLTLVGRIPLGQWLMLMIYSKSISKGKGHSPLMLLVKSRTELMDKILKAVEPNVKSNMLGEAYFVGVLSLIDTIFGVRLEDILDQMHISDDVKNAILKDEGKLGEIYALVRSTEAFDVKAIVAFENKYNLEHDTIEQLVVQSMEDVNKFENPELDES